MVNWSESYNVDIIAIDNQHKILFDIARDSAALLNQTMDDKHDQILTVLTKLKNYTLFHFQTEEKLMIQANYPKLLSHKALHDEFIESIEGILHKLDIHQDDDVIREILVFLIDWLTNHILKVDKYMAKEITKSH
ncbi:bacteriohemerythrin [Candidatus Epulonipiscium viviparus]|uniref:bacteriohemerythrin n=1 Tax=Candidatus Epulonipiscium viviparus TaxID=420336 RepID=UPI00016C09ED|nr:bacteriohemerythrin [Candidatus Epulopiscium viviparus]